AMKLAREKWGPIFLRYGVDLVLTGHLHEYYRGAVPENPAANGSVGPVWVSTTSGGCCIGSQLYQVLKVDGDTITFDSFADTGRIHDAFSLKKNSAGERQLTDRRPEGAKIVGFYER